MTSGSRALAVRAAELLARYEELGTLLSSPEILDDPNRLREAARAHSELDQAAEPARRYVRLLDQLRQAEELAEAGEDGGLAELAAEEVSELEAELEGLEEELRDLLIPVDPLDNRPAVVEIRAGTGGDEAGLFAADLYRMYARFADERGWKVEVISSSEGALSGLKEVVFVVRGRDAYGYLRYESGVHRVQRVPVTESSGRIHTSAASVAVLPEAEEVDVEIAPSELKIDVYRSSGPGGQSVNTTDSAVRITHVPTGLVVTCQDEKSQHKNKAKALKVLRSRLLDMRVAKQEADRARERRLQVGTGDRSAKIRTYNFPQNRVTDHRIGLTLHRLEGILAGDLDRGRGCASIRGPQRTPRDRRRVNGLPSCEPGETRSLDGARVLSESGSKVLASRPSDWWLTRLAFRAISWWCPVRIRSAPSRTWRSVPCCRDGRRASRCSTSKGPSNSGIWCWWRIGGPSFHARRRSNSSNRWRPGRGGGRTSGRISPVPDIRSPLGVILDVGTGSGAIALALVSEGIAARAVGLDISEAALEQARENRARLGLEAVVDLRPCNETVYDALLPDERFDAIISNPPYIRDEDLAGLAREVGAHDPPVALAGGRTA